MLEFAFSTLALVMRGMKIAYGLIYTFFLLVLATYLVMRKQERKSPQRKVSRSQLPPGSMGWPYIGETLQFFSENPNMFFASKQKRYGEIFKTHLLGCPCVMLASPEAARFVLVTQAHLFKPTYPRSKEALIGPSALFFHQGEYHLRLRKLVQGSLSPVRLRGLVPDIESIVLSMLRTWDGQRVVTYHEMKKLSFDVGTLIIFGENLDERFRTEMKKNYLIVDKGYNSFPTNIPGTRYHKAIQARKRLGAILSDIVKERRKNQVVLEENLLGCLMNSKDDRGGYLRDDQIADNIIGVLFAARDTTASVMAWIIKYLHDNPKLLEAVKAEQTAIEEVNENGRRTLTWAQTRSSMVLTHKVILESLRMSSIISFTFREAVADVEYKGYLIPKGWKVMPLFRNIHHSPEFFKDAGRFDPSRFQVAPKPNTFLPFGNGVHSCPGNELAKLEMLILIHHLVTKYRSVRKSSFPAHVNTHVISMKKITRDLYPDLACLPWKILGSQNEIEHSPFPVPKHGLPARFWRASN